MMQREKERGEEKQDGKNSGQHREFTLSESRREEKSHEIVGRCVLIFRFDTIISFHFTLRRSSFDILRPTIANHTIFTVIHSLSLPRVSIIKRFSYEIPREFSRLPAEEGRREKRREK